MQTQLTRPGVLPAVLLNSASWNAEAVRRVSFDTTAWRCILVTDENGPVGALCFTEPDIYPYIVVDTVVLHPERSGSTAQMVSLIAAALPAIRAQAARFKATRIVFESTSPMLRSVLAAYGAREESVSLSIGLEEPNIVERMIPLDSPEAAVFVKQKVAQADGLLSRCGRPCASKAGKAAHERHCPKCKET